MLIRKRGLLMEYLDIALFLAVANEALVKYIVAPIKQRFPNINYWWLTYVALITGTVLGMLSGVNIFTGYLDGVSGQVLTSLFIGGGSSLIHDLFTQKAA